MGTSKDTFKNAIDKAFTTQPNVKLNSSTMGDALKYKSSFTEEKIEDISKDNQKEMVDGIVDIVKQVKDLNNRKLIVKDMIKKFKKENIKTDLNKFMKDCGIEKSEKKETNEVMDDEYEYETFLEKTKRLKKSAKDQFNKDLLDDKDYVDFKKNAEFKDDRGVTHSHGTPHAINRDPFIKKKKYSRVGKEEATEATGSGSSGAYSGPVFGGGDNDEFWEKSRSETPGLKESDVEKVEAKEATTSGSVGGYESPSMWAKSTSKKDWGPSRKTQYPGGGFVKIKKKCTKFPYCNQGDINNLKITKNESVKEAINTVANKMGVSPNVVKTILEHEYEILNKRIK
jgi:hypothetical protein